MEATSSSKSQLNNGKYGEIYAKEAYQMNLYHMTNYGSCRSQF